MKNLFIVAMCCLTLSGHASESSHSLLGKGQALLEQQEYAEALRSFENIVLHTNPSSHEEKVDYLKAAYQAAMISDFLQDIENSEKYRTLFCQQSLCWFGYPRIVTSQLFECHEYARVWVCTKCEYVHVARFPKCQRCGNPELKERYLPVP